MNAYTLPLAAAVFALLLCFAVMNQPGLATYVIFAAVGGGMGYAASRSGSDKE